MYMYGVWQPGVSINISSYILKRLHVRFIAKFIVMEKNVYFLISSVARIIMKEVWLVQCYYQANKFKFNCTRGYLISQNHFPSLITYAVLTRICGR